MAESRPITREGATFDLVFATAKDSIANGAPGLSAAIRDGIARSIAYKLTRTPGTGGIEAAAERIIARIEDAIPEPIFTCQADREEAVEIAQHEIVALATGGARG